MAKLKIVKFGDPLLRKASRPVEEITPRICTLIDDMIDTMRDAGGCGLAAVQVGVLRMSNDIVGLAELSRNIGIIHTEEDSVELVLSTRSAIESQLEEAIDYIDAFAEMCEGTAEHYSRYPGWQYAKVSPLRDKYIVAAREVLGVEPKVFAIHAGLECGVIKSHIPDIDIIAIGPEAGNIHTPDEYLDLASFERLFKLVERMLKK